MSRIPNPWIVVPVAAAAIAGGAVGYLVTDASCSPGSCGFVAALIGLVTAVGAAVGVGVVVVLALKSLSEWREHGDREITIRQEREGPPTC